VRAVPESFDGMLEELADSAAASVTMPDVSEVRRRARQRTVHRRRTASALAFALLCVAGVAGATIDGRARRLETVTPLSAPGVGFSPLATSSALGTVTPAPSPGASTSADNPYDATYAGVWSTDSSQDSQGPFMIIFPDGAVGVGEKDGLPLCYGQLATPSSATPIAGATFANSTASAGSGVSMLVFAESGCASANATHELVFDDTGSGSTLALTALAPTDASGYSTRYSRLLDLGDAGDAAEARQQVLLKTLVGDWTRVDSPSQLLRISADGAVAYTTAGTDSTAFNGTGEIDGYYGSSARVMTACPAAVEKMQQARGEGTGQICGLLLITPGTSSGEISVYTGVGLEVFSRVG
jgi:hypothetical protein